MQSLIQGKQRVGEISEDGNVFARAGHSRQQVGSVTKEGTVHLGTETVGRVDTAGNVFNVAETMIGTVDKSGKVFFGKQSIGFVPGDDPRLGGAALLLLFDPPRPPRVQTEQSSGSSNWIAIAICAGVAMLVITVAIAFVVATAIVWAVMLILASLTALWLSTEVAGSLPENRIRDLQTMTWETKRGPVQQIAPSSLSSFLRPLPFLFLALVPSLVYGYVIVCISISTSTPDNITGNFVLFALALAAGTAVSFLAARIIMRTRMSTLILARLSNPQVVPLKRTHDWNRLASYAVTGLAAFLVLGGGTSSYLSRRNAPRPTVNTSSLAANSVPASSSSSAASFHVPETGGDAEPDASQVKPVLDATIVPMQGEHFSQTRNVYLHDNDIAGWSYSGVRYALNELYARHGLVFKSLPIQHHFLKYPWYQPIAGRTEAIIEAQFTPIERANQFLLARKRDELQRLGQAIP